ncbi:MAG: metallophosphoesterase [Natrialbaceae archaeon]|nr:metallophosphoesterase [Natrialbaceae archaeon]
MNEPIKQPSSKPRTIHGSSRDHCRCPHARGPRRRNRSRAQLGAGRTSTPDIDPDHLFVLGDIIEHAETAETDRQHVRRVHECLTDANLPLTYLLGNHDVENLSRTNYGDLLGQDRFFGVRQVDDVPILFLDTSWASVPGARGILGGPQLEWLQTTLPSLDRCLVFAHHPIGYFDLSTNHWFATFPERAFFGDRLEFLSLVRDLGDVRATITGHIHETRSTSFWDIPHLSVNAFSKETRDKALTGTYAVVDIEKSVNVEIRDRTNTQATFELES